MIGVDHRLSRFYSAFRCINDPLPLLQKPITPEPFYAGMNGADIGRARYGPANESSCNKIGLYPQYFISL
jgi:hypothetical protein